MNVEEKKDIEKLAGLLNELRAVQSKSKEHLKKWLDEVKAELLRVSDVDFEAWYRIDYAPNLEIQIWFLFRGGEIHITNEDGEDIDIDDLCPDSIRRVLIERERFVKILINMVKKEIELHRQAARE